MPVLGRVQYGLKSHALGTRIILCILNFTISARPYCAGLQIFKHLKVNFLSTDFICDHYLGIKILKFVKSLYRELNMLNNYILRKLFEYVNFQVGRGRRWCRT